MTFHCNLIYCVGLQLLFIKKTTISNICTFAPCVGVNVLLLRGGKQLCVKSLS